MTAMSDGARRAAPTEAAGPQDYRATAWSGAPPIAAAPLGRRWEPWWWTAVAWAGTGHYARSRAALERGARLARADPAGRSLLASTAGSIQRQLGRHDRGAGGRARRVGRRSARPRRHRRRRAPPGSGRRAVGRRGLGGDPGRAGRRRG